MRRLLLTITLFSLMTGGFLFACNLDFNEAIPCETDQHCPEGMFCEQQDHRCTSGTVPTEDTGPADSQSDEQTTQDDADGEDDTDDTSQSEPDTQPDLTE